MATTITVTIPEASIRRFWSKVHKCPKTGCWLWTGRKTQKGYGSVLIACLKIKAHRLAWLLTNGPIPHGLLVCHNCPNGDNPACCNPTHLWLGTNEQNQQDCLAKGRRASGERHGAKLHPERLARGPANGMVAHPELVARGERAGMSKLTEERVRKIRRDYAGGSISMARLAAEHHVAEATVSDVVHRRTWAHILD